MHPSKFFKECGCKTGFDAFEIFDNDVKRELENVHPKNFIKTKITLPVYKVILEYETAKGNFKRAEKILVMDTPIEADDEWAMNADIAADGYVLDYNHEHPDNPLRNLEVVDVQFLCEAVLPLG